MTRVLTPISPVLAACAGGVYGYATVRIAITADGRVASSRVRRSSYGDARRDACFHARIAIATFPATGVPTHAEHTFAPRLGAAVAERACPKWWARSTTCATSNSIVERHARVGGAGLRWGEGGGGLGRASRRASRSGAPLSRPRARCRPRPIVGSRLRFVGWTGALDAPSGRRRDPGYQLAESTPWNPPPVLTSLGSGLHPELAGALHSRPRCPAPANPSSPCS